MFCCKVINKVFLNGSLKQELTHFNRNLRLAPVKKNVLRYRVFLCFLLCNVIYKECDLADYITTKHEGSDENKTVDRSTQIEKSSRNRSILAKSLTSDSDDKYYDDDCVKTNIRITMSIRIMMMTLSDSFILSQPSE